MIRKSSLALAEAIVVGHNLQGVVPVKNLILGLSDESFGSAAYTADFRNEIPHITENISQHTPYINATSDKLAEVIRDGFDMVKTYGVPFGKALANSLGVLYTRKSLVKLALSQLNAQFVNVQNPVLDYGIYPTSVAAGNDFSLVKFPGLTKLDCEYVEAKAVIEYINSQHPEVVALFRSKPDLDMGQVAQNIFNEWWFKSTFFEEGGMYNFTNIKSMEVEELMAMQVLLAKMYSDTSPVPWFRTGSLQQYREHVFLFHNALSQYLINLKALLGSYQNRVIAIMETKHCSLTGGKTESDQNILLTGEVKVFYTPAAIAQLEAAGIGSMEWLAACLYSKLRNVPFEPVAALGDNAFVSSVFDKYLSVIDSVMVDYARQSFLAKGREVIEKFIRETPLLLERVNSLIGEGQLLDGWVDTVFGIKLSELYRLTLNVKDKGEEEVGECITEDGEGGSFLNTVLSSDIVPHFLQRIGCNVAAEILLNTYLDVDKEETLVEKRQRLTCAVIKFIVKNSIGKQE